MTVACVLITHLRAKVELRRQPGLEGTPAVIVDRSQGRPIVVDRFPAAAVPIGATLEEALSRHAGTVVLEADEPAYRAAFQRVLTALQGVSDRVEAAELGTAYVGLDGLAAMYGSEARLVGSLLSAVPASLAPRVGVAEGKFPALAAASMSAPHSAVKVPQDAAAFLAPHPVGLLPVAAEVRAGMGALRPADPRRRGGDGAGVLRRPVRVAGRAGMGPRPRHRPQSPCARSGRRRR